MEDIEAERYGKAFRLLRQHKMDINMIYDVNPAKFLANIKKFVDEVAQVDYLNLFINSLVNEESGSELSFMRPREKEEEIRHEHIQFMAGEIEGKPIDNTTKINIICDALKAELEVRNEDNKYLLPILTIYVKKQPQQLKEVLSLIREMQQKEKEAKKTSRVVPPHLNPATMKKDIDPNSLKLGAKEALEYVSWLVNPDRLFDVALTTYDFELVTLVATQT
mmetsp:Transcript_26788/g.40860  ORF Transcript_26788/g.40860 Transcript_26788/m.40860 type:complete len:221 (-) Transcript_26788:1300-1962(-)